MSVHLAFPPSIIMSPSSTKGTSELITLSVAWPAWTIIIILLGFFREFTNDFKENLGLTGFRVSGSGPGGINIGAGLTVDRNQYLGLRDSDGDGRPDLVDDFPDDSNYWLDTDGDGLADVFSGEFDIESI